MTRNSDVHFAIVQMYTKDVTQSIYYAVHRTKQSITHSVLTEQQLGIYSHTIPPRNGSESHQLVTAGHRRCFILVYGNVPDNYVDVFTQKTFCSRQIFPENCNVNSHFAQSIFFWNSSAIKMDVCGYTGQSFQTDIFLQDWKSIFSSQMYFSVGDISKGTFQET